ncbi:hypothetical protein RI367_006505 [Sorochytrium milnesiophthora]
MSARDDVDVSFEAAHDAAAVMNDENMLPPKISLALILTANFLFNVSFYIIIPTAADYATILGATQLFGGLVIGVVTFSSAMSLIPLSRVPMFRDRYIPCLNLAAGALCAGNILYAIAMQTNFLYLILIGRFINGFGFTGWLFVKRYCTDPRVVGLRRRTMCSTLLVTAQTLGMVAGPLLGGWIAHVSPDHTVNRLFNVETNPAWVMTAVWFMYWIAVRVWFQEVPAISANDARLQSYAVTVAREPFELTLQIKLVAAAMSFIAFTVFFELGSWESSIPNLGKHLWLWSEFTAGNFIGLIGLGSFVLILPMTRFTRALQDRWIMVVGIALGLAGSLVCLAMLCVGPRGFPSESAMVATYGVAWFLMCWGMNLASTITLSLMSKQMPNHLSDKASLVVQLSNYTGRTTGAIWGAAREAVTDVGVAGLQTTVIALALLFTLALWRPLKACTG